MGSKNITYWPERSITPTVTQPIAMKMTEEGALADLSEIITGELAFDNMAQEGRFGLERLDLTHCLHIGEGGTADVYRVMRDDGKPFALKVFNQIIHPELVRRITNNLLDGERVLSYLPFTSPRIIPKPGPQGWYVMNYFEGKDIKSRMDDGEDLTLDPRLPDLLMTYTQMLEFVHREKFLLRDPNWGNVLTAENDIRVCDFDLMTRDDDPYKNLDGQPTVYGAPVYVSRDIIRGEDGTWVSDLESFALMIDHLYNGNSWREDAAMDGATAIMSAMIFTDVYPAKRQKNLPYNLGKVVKALVENPRAIGVHHKHIQEAIRKDYSDFFMQKYMPIIVN